MKVTNNPLSNTSGLEKTGATDRAGATKATETGKTSKKALVGDSSVEISDQARLMKEARDIVYATPDVRSEKVSDLKRRIKDGTYKADSAAIADKLVDEHLATNFGKNNV